MATKLYVGNLPYTTTDDSLKTHFETAGTVESASVVTDRESGRSRGFGFVEMPESEAEAAIEKLDGAELEGRALKVNVARPREER
jgi:RNA recognition motif-containing protein